MWKQWFQIALTLALFLIALQVPASNYQGKVANVTPYGGMVYIFLGNGNFDGTASVCLVTPDGMMYVADPSTPFGRTMIAVALTAKVVGNTVYAYGTGTCVSGAPYYGGTGEGANGLDSK